MVEPGSLDSQPVMFLTYLLFITGLGVLQYLIFLCLGLLFLFVSLFCEIMYLILFLKNSKLLIIVIFFFDLKTGF